MRLFFLFLFFAFMFLFLFGFIGQSYFGLRLNNFFNNDFLKVYFMLWILIGVCLDITMKHKDQ